MPLLQVNLELPRCPHCSVNQPNLVQVHGLQTNNHAGQDSRHWKVYQCARCGGLVIAASRTDNGSVIESYPKSPAVDTSVPTPASDYLAQALESLHTPAGAVMLAASAVDAMLKAKGHTEGGLYARIDAAVEEGLITEGMGRWAHEVRLDANEPRHADEEAPLPTDQRARKGVDFTLALAEILFVLPARIERGLEATGGEG